MNNRDITVETPMPGYFFKTHADRFLRLSPEQRQTWHDLNLQKMKPVFEMPHVTLDEKRARMLAGLAVYQEMEQWMLERLTE